MFSAVSWDIIDSRGSLLARVWFLLSPTGDLRTPISGCSPARRSLYGQVERWSLLRVFSVEALPDVTQPIGQEAVTRMRTSANGDAIICMTSCCIGPWWEKRRKLQQLLLHFLPHASAVVAHAASSGFSSCPSFPVPFSPSPPLLLFLFFQLSSFFPPLYPVSNAILVASHKPRHVLANNF